MKQIKMIEKVLKTFKNKSITVFGGTGTVGSIIIKHLREFSPKVIRVFSNDENSLWKSQKKWGDDNMRYLLGDVRNLERVRVALDKTDYVFNCVAVKHITFSEYNPLETVYVNIIGLENIIRACVEKKVKKLLHISTDKAVEPIGVYGCTKRIGERLLQIRWSQNPTVDMVCVRFGNVFGSRGSIIPLVRKQKELGKPITITSENMVRFFMKPDEVKEFIMKAFINGKQGEIWIPDLKPQRLLDVIKKEVGADYPIEIIGFRKCEKLQEKLFFPHELPDIVEKDGCFIIPNDFKKWL